jgi:hypothetical protein
MQEEINCALRCFSADLLSFFAAGSATPSLSDMDSPSAGSLDERVTPSGDGAGAADLVAAVESGLADAASMASAGEAEVIVAEVRGGFSNGMENSPAELVAPNSQP